MQPGTHSVEVYESVIRAELGCSTTLKVFIAQIGILQYIRLRGLAAREYVLKPDRLDVQDQDVCFVRLTGQEHRAVYKFLETHNYTYAPPQRVTPLGRLIFNRPDDDDKRADCLEAILYELGLQGTTFPRSILPPGAKPLSLASNFKIQMGPGPDCPELHGNVDILLDRHRIDWAGLSRE